MNEKTKLLYQQICALCGPGFLISFIVLWGLIGHNLPAPPSPALNPHDLAQRYAETNGGVRAGFILSLIAVVLYLPWTALLTTQMARIEGKFPVMSMLQLLGGGLTVMVVSFSAFFWVTAAFRPDRDPSEIQLLNDLGWLCIDLQYACTSLQMFAMALVGLADQSRVRLFPRWVCFLTIWCGSSFLPASLTGIFKSGPFAWNGLFCYYLPYFCWLCWYAIASYYMRREVAGRANGATISAQHDGLALGAAE